MKSLFRSRTFWIAVAQGLVGILVVVETQFPSVGLVVIIKSVLDVLLRIATVTEIK